MLKKYSAVIVLGLIAAVLAATFIGSAMAKGSSLTFHSEQAEPIETIIL